MKELYKNLVCFAVTVACLCPLYAQSGFNRIIDFDEWRSANFDDIKFLNNKLYIVGNALIDSVNLWGQAFSVLDTNGIVLFQKTFLDEDSASLIVNNSPSKFVITKSKKFVIPYYLYDRNKMGILILDSLGQKILMREFPNTEYTIFPNDIIEFGANYYLFGIIQRKTDQIDNYVIKTDSTGSFKWIKYYGSPTNNEYFGNVLDNHNGTFTISSATSTPTFSVEPYGSQGWKQPWIFTIDTSGKKIWEWHGLQNDPNTLGGGPIYKMKNGDWIVISQEFKWNTQHKIWFSASTPTITKFDSLFNKQWKLYLANYTGYWDNLIDLEFDSTNNEFVAGGHRVFYYSFNNAELEAWIVKFTPEGQITLNTSDTIWSDPINGVMHFAAGLSLSPSRSIYMDGYVEHQSSPHREYGWVLKMTPDGCIDTICITTSLKEPIPSNDKLTVYPNPASDYLIVESAEPLVSLEVYNLTGKLVCTLQPGLATSIKVDTHLFNSGLYVIVGKREDGATLTGRFVVDK